MKQTPEHRAKIAAANLGRKHSHETLAKLRRPKTEEHKRAISLAAQNRCKPSSFSSKSCAFCQDSFTPSYHTDKFCSTICYFAAHLQTLPDDYDSCWEWYGARVPDGYGVANRKGQIRAHCLSYREFIGAIPPGMIVRHTCDNPPCVNPRHLLVGTPKDNVRDRVVRNRSARMYGKVRRATLTPEQAIAIYRSDSPSKMLANEYGVTRVTVNAIRRGKAWAHVTLYGK